MHTANVLRALSVVPEVYDGQAPPRKNKLGSKTSIEMYDRSLQHHVNGGAAGAGWSTPLSISNCYKSPKSRRKGSRSKNAW